MDMTDGKYYNQVDHIFCNSKQKSAITSVKTRAGADCSTEHEPLLADFRIKLKRFCRSTQITKPNLQNTPNTNITEVKAIRQTQSDR